MHPDELSVLTFPLVSAIPDTGPTCEGSVASGPGGGLLLSLPHNPRWRYPADRKNMTVFRLTRNATNQTMPTYSVAGSDQIWGGPAAYSAMTTDGDFVLFEGGTEYRYASVMVSPVQVGANSSTSL